MDVALSCYGLLTFATGGSDRFIILYTFEIFELLAGQPTFFSGR